MTWAAFGPLALLVVDDEGVVLDSVIRYGLGVPTGLVSLALTYLPNYRRIWQPMITAAILFSGLVWVIHRAFVRGRASRLGLRRQHADPDLRVHPQPAAVPLLGARRRRADRDAQRRRVPLHERRDDRRHLRRLLPPGHRVHRIGRRVRAGAIAATALPARPRARPGTRPVRGPPAEHPAGAGRRPPEAARPRDRARSHRAGVRRGDRRVRRPRRLHAAVRPVAAAGDRRGAGRGVLALRRAGRAVRTREDQDDRGCVHGGRRRPRAASGRRRGGGADGPRDARGGSPAPMAERRRDDRADRDGHRARRRRGDRHPEVRLRPVGRHREHGGPDGVERDARARSRSPTPCTIG